MGRTLPPLFRTVRRVCRILLTRTPCRFLHRVFTEFCGSPLLADFCGKSKSGRFCRILRKRLFFVWQISAEQSCGAGSGSHLDISPLSVCGFLLMCCFCLFSACKEKPVAAPPAAFILLIGLPPRQAGGYAP